MRKIVLILLLLPTFFMVVSGASNAQKRNPELQTVNKVEQKVQEDKKVNNSRKINENNKKRYKKRYNRKLNKKYF